MKPLERVLYQDRRILPQPMANTGLGATLPNLQQPAAKCVMQVKDFGKGSSRISLGAVAVGRLKPLEHLKRTVPDQNSDQASEAEMTRMSLCEGTVCRDLKHRSKTFGTGMKGIREKSAPWFLLLSPASPSSLLISFSSHSRNDGLSRKFTDSLPSIEDPETELSESLKEGNQ